MFTPRVNSTKIEPPDFQRARLNTFNTPKAYLLAVTDEAEEKYKKMKILVSKWMLSKYEQEARETVPYIFRCFSPRVNTTGPLVAASIAAREAQDSAIGLNDEIDDCKFSCQLSQKKISEIGGDLDQLVSSVSTEVINKALSKDQRGGCFSLISNFFDNKKETSPTFREKETLLYEASIWHTINSYEEQPEKSLSRRSSNDLGAQLEESSVSQSPVSQSSHRLLASNSPGGLLRLASSSSDRELDVMGNNESTSDKKHKETRRWSIQRERLSVMSLNELSPEGQKCNTTNDQNRQELKLKEEALLRNQATWNIYSGVALNMSATAVVVSGVLYFVKNGENRG